MSTAPFTYTYKGKARTFSMGDFYYLNNEVVEEAGELIYILSPHFPYRDHIHIYPDPYLDKYQKEVAKEVFLEHNPVVEPEYVPEIASPTPGEFTVNLNDAGHDLNPKPPVEEVLETPAQQQAPVEVFTDRQSQLSNLTVKQLKDLAATLGIEFKSKQLTIEEIIAKESASDNNTKNS